MQRVSSSRIGPNRLAGGGFEDHRVMLQSGWNYFPSGSPGIQSMAELAAVSARSGHYGLRLSAWNPNADGKTTTVEMPPVWIASPPVPVEAGTMIAIHGWTQVPAPVTGSTDGLMIVDSLGGAALAQRIGETNGWREFTLYRCVPASGKVVVNFVLSGLGEAWIDDVTIQALGSAPIQAADRRQLTPWRLPPTDARH
jgi:hypothetical protein